MSGTFWKISLTPTSAPRASAPAISTNPRRPSPTIPTAWTHNPCTSYFLHPCLPQQPNKAEVTSRPGTLFQKFPSLAPRRWSAPVSRFWEKNWALLPKLPGRDGPRAFSQPTPDQDLKWSQFWLNQPTLPPPPQFKPNEDKDFPYFTKQPIPYQADAGNPAALPSIDKVTPQAIIQDYAHMRERHEELLRHPYFEAATQWHQAQQDLTYSTIQQTASAIETEAIERWSYNLRALFQELTHPTSKPWLTQMFYNYFDQRVSIVSALDFLFQVVDEYEAMIALDRLTPAPLMLNELSPTPSNSESS